MHSGFGTKAVVDKFDTGSKSNIDRIKRSLQEKELITIVKGGVYLSDAVFEIWFKREML